MAVTEQRQLYNPQIEALATQYGTALGDIGKRPLTGAQITGMAPTVAPQTALQQRATSLAGTGVGAYAPYVAAAGAAGTTAGGILGTAGTQLGTAQTGLGGVTAQYAAPAVTGLQGAQATLGGVSPYISAAETGLATAGGTGALGLGTAGAALTGAGTAMGDVSQYVTGAGGLTGPMTGAQMATIDPTTGQTITPTLAAGSYMSPYQSQVIDTTLAEFDRQAAMRQQSISDAAVGVGGYGGGREGVMQSEYQLGSDRNRAMIEAQLQQQGYTQAQAARQADMAAQLGIGGAQQQYASGLAGLAGARAGLAGQQAALAQGQLGLGQATGALAQQEGALAQGYLAPGQFAAGVLGQQAGMAGQRAGLGQAQLGLGQYQLGIGGAQQGMAGADISTVGRVGAADQAYAQAQLDAAREKERMAIYEPYERMGYIGSGLSGLMQGMGPQYQFSTQPNQTPLQTALGIGSTLGGIYGDYQYGKALGKL
jgi:hypothetical protein